MIDRSPHVPEHQLSSLKRGRSLASRLVQSSVERLRRSSSGTNASARLGTRGERAAEKYLRKHGYKVLARNVRTVRGEADLVCRDEDGSIVVVEVKSRALPKDESRRRGTPENALTVFKQRKLLQVADDLVRANNLHDVPIRIDLIAVDFEPGNRRNVCGIRHYQRAVRRS